MLCYTDDSFIFHSNATASFIHKENLFAVTFALYHNVITERKKCVIIINVICKFITVRAFYMMTNKTKCIDIVLADLS